MSGLRWASGEPAIPARAVLVAPHPDDETLGYAGILRWLLDHGVDCTIVAVTDGEASHVASDVVAPTELAELRQAERRVALAAIGADAVPVERLRLPDGAVDAHLDVLVEALRTQSAEGTCFVVPWRGDAHPDHRAVAAAGDRTTSAFGGTMWEVPIWGRVHGVTERCSVLELGSFLRQKVTAAMAFRSQLHAIGPGPHDGPVIRRFELRAFLQPTEQVVLR